MQKIDLREVTKLSKSMKEYEDFVSLAELAIPANLLQSDKPIQLKYKVICTGKKVTVTGTMKLTEVQTACDACLQDFLYDLDVYFEEYFWSSYHLATEELPEDLEIKVYEGFELDLTETLRVNLLINVPLTNKCKSGCKGLCMYCGINLNEGTCNCSTEQVDPRLEILKSLLN